MLIEPAFTEIADRVHVLRHPVLDVNTTLIVGDEVAVVVDTLSTDEQARALVRAIRAVTRHPLTIVNTHHHFDHCYGNRVVAATTPGCAVWAHTATAATMRDHGRRWQHLWHKEWLHTHPDLAAGLAAVVLLPPDRTVHNESTMDIGGRVIGLHHWGRGHTDGDLVVTIPDAGVALAGDLVEQGAPPSFDDSYPVDWPETLAAMLETLTAGSLVVPGHGAVVDLEFVRDQHRDLARLAWLIREGHGDGVDAAAVAEAAPYDTDVATTAVRRGYAELAGRI